MAESASEPLAELVSSVFRSCSKASLKSSGEIRVRVMMSMIIFYASSHANVFQNSFSKVAAEGG